MGPAKKPTFEEWLDVSELAFDWAESYDDKDWERLRGILAPTVSVGNHPLISLGNYTHPRGIQVNYGGVNNVVHTALPASDFITMMQNPLFLGDSNIDSQHLLALSKWEKISDTEIHSSHQSRAAHIRWNEGRKTVAAKGHGHGVVKTIYKKVDGEWKWGGIETRVRFNEYEFEKVFLGAAGKFDEEKTAAAA